MKQTTFDGTVKIINKPFRNKSGLKFHPVSSQDPVDILREVEEKHGRDKFYVMSSGGKDSQTVLNFVAEQEKLAGVVHIKTNVGLRVTTDFVKDYCQSKGYPCHIIEPIPKFIYVAQVLEKGFPGPRQHSFIMGWLKYRAMFNFAMTIDKKHHCLITGVRKFESARRNSKYKAPIQNDGSLWFCSPYFYKSDAEVYKEFLTAGLPITPAYEMGFPSSGECLCGSFADLDLKQHISKIDPELAAFIAWMEEGVRRWGTPRAKKYAKWGGTANMDDIENQETLFEEAQDLICGQECGVGTYKEYDTNPLNSK